MIDNGSMKLLLDILENPRMEINNFIELHGLNLRQLNAKLEKLNDHLKQNKFNEIKIESSYFVYDSKIESSIINDDFLKSENIYLDDSLRPELIYLYVFIRQTEVSNYHLQWLLKVSKNTAFSDVKILKELCLKYHVQFMYSRKNGYHLQGTEMAKRYLAIRCLNNILEYPLGRKTVEHLIEDWNHDSSIKHIVEKISFILNKYNLLVPNSRLDVISLYYKLLTMRNVKELEFSDYQISCLDNSNIIKVVKDIYDSLDIDWNKEEACYLGALLLSIIQGNIEDNNIPDLQNYIDHMIDFVENKLAVNFDKKEILKKSLEYHMIPAFYRILFDIPLKNPLLERIMTDYMFIFDIVKDSLEFLEDKLSKKIPNDEIAYLTMFFGGNLKARKLDKKQFHAKVICPNGISASYMLKSQLKELFPEFIWSVDSYSSDNCLEDIDMIFSTIFMKADIPVYVTKPLLSIYEKNYLLNIVNRDFNITNRKLPNIDSILEIVQKYATINNYQQLEKELSSYINNYSSLERNNDPMLKDLLTKEYINFSDEALDWQEAIALSAKPLQESDKIEERYVDAIINKVNELGPYIHIGKGVAIPHARPEEGVKNIGMSLLKLSKPTLLMDKDEHAVDILITLAAVDNSTHLLALSELTQILSNNDKMEKLKKSKTVEDVLALINEK